MKYISVKEASKKWGISERRVRILCSENRIDGVTKSSWAWHIPSNAPKPSDGRIIRHIKNIDLRVNSINFKNLIDRHEQFNKIISNQNKYLSYFDDSVNRFLLMALSQENLEESDILRVLNNEYVPSISYSTQLIIINAKSIIVNCFKQTGYGPILPSYSKADPFLSNSRLREINDCLYKGVDDYFVSKYRDRPLTTTTSLEEKEVDVAMQIETLIFQYESEWESLNSLVKATFMFSQLLKIQPFLKHNFLFASIIFAIILLEGHYPLAIIPVDLIQELKANLTLTLKRGNYSNLVSMFEVSLIKELDSLIDINEI
ncbi:MAG: hypothetical protein PQJ45_02930 [Sphaerochaetaceae bacterium]|nr:hypothetical protein [Sphaerochaetaceae bacterium]